MVTQLWDTDAGLRSEAVRRTLTHQTHLKSLAETNLQVSTERNPIQLSRHIILITLIRGIRFKSIRCIQNLINSSSIVETSHVTY